MSIINKVKEYVSKKYNHDEYNWIHNEFVTKIAIILGKKLNADIEILEIAARFHDIDFSRGKEFHTQDSANVAETFLKKQNFPKNKIEQVKLAILCHTSKVIKTIKNPSKEGKILYDADKMWTMTPMGFARTIAHRYKENSSYNYIIKKLEKAISKYDSLFFDESKELVKQDRKICIKFLNRMKDEKSNSN